MGGMVERVARAISTVNGMDPEAWQIFTGDAKAAIAAMREPTEGMLWRGKGANAGPRSSVHGYIYAAMINAALEDTK